MIILNLGLIIKAGENDDYSLGEFCLLVVCTVLNNLQSTVRSQHRGSGANGWERQDSDDTSLFT